MGLAHPLASKIKPPVVNRLHSMTATSYAFLSLKNRGASILFLKISSCNQTGYACFNNNNIYFTVAINGATGKAIPSVIAKPFARALLLVPIFGVPAVAQLIACHQAAIMKDLKAFDL